MLWDCSGVEMAAVKAPDGHAGGGNAVCGAEVGTGLPAVSGAGGWVFEKDPEFVQERKGITVGVFGGFQAVVEGFDSGNSGGKYYFHAHTVLIMMTLVN